MEDKMKVIREAAALIGADEETLTEDEAKKILRSMVMSNENVRIRRARANFNRIREERDE